MELACFELVNTEMWYGLGPLEDRLLEEPGWLHDFLARWALSVAAAPTKRQLAELVRLRALLRRMIETAAQRRQLAQADLAELNTFLARRPVTRQLVTTAGEHRIALVPATRDWSWVLAEVAASFGQLLAVGEATRIKICHNPECQWAFYDDSKNRRRRWCDPTICGNRDKVRRFRARQRTAQTQT